MNCATASVCEELVDEVVHRGVGEDVAVVGEEELVALEVGTHATQALTDRGVHAGVDEGDGPVADVGAEHVDVLPALGQHEVVGGGLAVVEEVVLDGLGPMAEAEDELGVPEVREVPHDVPQHRAAADRHHRLGQRLVVGPHPHAETAAEQNDLHARVLSAGPLTLAPSVGKRARWVGGRDVG